MWTELSASVRRPLNSGQMRGNNPLWLFLVLRLWQHHQRQRLMSSIFHDCCFTSRDRSFPTQPRDLCAHVWPSVRFRNGAPSLIRKPLWINRPAFGSGSPACAEGEEQHQRLGEGSCLSNLSFASRQRRNHPSPDSHRWKSSISTQVKSDYCVSKQACLHTSMSNKALKRVKIASDVAVQWIPRPQPPSCLPAAWSLTRQHLNSANKTSPAGGIDSS